MFHCGPQSCFRHQPVDKPQTQSVIRAERFTGKNQLVGLFGADQLRQHNRGKRRNDAHLDLGLRKLGVGGGDHHVAEGNQLRARTDGGAIHHNDQGLGDVAECLKDAIEGVQGLKDAVGFGIFQRDAGAKCLLRRVEDDALDVIAPIQAFHCLGYFHHQGHSENVVRRMVQGDMRHESGRVERDIFMDLWCCRSCCADLDHGISSQNARIPRDYAMKPPFKQALKRPYRHYLLFKNPKTYPAGLVFYNKLSIISGCSPPRNEDEKLFVRRTF